jgi:hypothetical protein
MNTRIPLLACFLAPLALVGCDADDSATDPAEASQTPVGKGDVVDAAPQELLFSRDARPVDGALNELHIVQNGHGTFDVSLRTAWFDRIAGQEVDETELVATDLDCAFELPDAVVCSRDDRPVDGALTVVEVLRDENDMWDATLRTAFFDRFKGVEVDETEELASDLAMSDDDAAGQESATFERDARPVDGALTQVMIVPGEIGHDITLRTAFFDRIAGQEVDETIVVATGLACEFDGSVHCVRDDLPVDGTRVEVVVTPGPLGGFDATLTITWFDHFEGTLNTETDTLGTRLEPVE